MLTIKNNEHPSTAIGKLPSEVITLKDYVSDIVPLSVHVATSVACQSCLTSDVGVQSMAHVLAELSTFLFFV